MQQLVLIPGLNNTAAVFDGVVDGLRGAADVRALDCPAIADLDALARELLAGLPERFWLCGFSFGGYVAMSLLAQAAQRIEGLALICSSPGADTPAQAVARQAAIDKVQQGSYAQLIAAQAPLAFHPNSLSDAALMQRRAAMVDAYGRQRFIAHQQAALGRPDRTALLRAGPRPVLIMAASDDRLFPPATLQALAQDMAGARYALIEGAGHLAPMERPQAVADALALWLRQDPGLPARSAA